MFKIRRVNGPANAAIIAKLQSVCMGGDQPSPAETGDWWIAYDAEGTAVGFGQLKPSSRYANCGYLSRAGVIPAARGHGLQRQLIRVRLRRARKLGWHHCFSDTLLNPQSANNLTACGFKIFLPKKPWAFKVKTLYWRIKL